MQNPFLDFTDYAIYNPGTLEMALPLIEAVGIKPRMRVLEIGAGSGKIACILAKHWNVTVITLEPWSDGADIQARAMREGVWDRVISMKLEVQHLPFSRDSFDAAIAFGTLEMIEKDRAVAPEQIKKILKPGSRFGIAEAMSLDVPKPSFEFDTLEENRKLFEHHSFEIAHASYFEHGYQWWLDNADRIQKHDEHERMVRADEGKSLSLGMLVGQKP